MNEEIENSIEISYYKEEYPSMCSFATKYVTPRTLYKKLKTMNLKVENISFLYLNGIQQSNEQIKKLIDWVDACRKEEEK